MLLLMSGFSLQRLKLWLFKLLMFNLLFPVSGEEEDDAFFVGKRVFR